MEKGLASAALRAAPPSPENPLTPVPATVLIVSPGESEIIGACAAVPSATPKTATHSARPALSLPMRSIVIALSPCCSCAYWQTSATTRWWGDGGGSPLTVTLTSNKALALTETGGIDDEQDCVVW